MIIFEGIDATGKSTLAKYCAKRLDKLRWQNNPIPVQSSEGPPKSQEEIHARIDKYYTLTNTLFDRHPCVSQPIYGKAREASVYIERDYLKHFYKQPHLFIYCEPVDTLRNHKIKPTDTLEHIRMLEENYHFIHRLYQQWALQHAQLIYRIGDDPEFIAQCVLNSLHLI